MEISILDDEALADLASLAAHTENTGQDTVELSLEVVQALLNMVYDNQREREALLALAAENRLYTALLHNSLTISQAALIDYTRLSDPAEGLALIQAQIYDAGLMGEVVNANATGVTGHAFIATNQIPIPTPEEGMAAVEEILQALREQGVEQVNDELTGESEAEADTQAIILELP